MAQLILVKHAMPHVEPGVPSRAWCLSDAGREGAVLLAQRLASYTPAVIVASTEPKATETAQIAATRLGVAMTTDDGLHENDRSGLGWLGTAELEARIARFFAEPETHVMGNETADQAHARFARAVDRICTAHPDETVVVVAHGTVMTLFVSRAAGIAPFPFWKRLGLPAIVVLSRPTFRVEQVMENVHADG